MTRTLPLILLLSLCSCGATRSSHRSRPSWIGGSLAYVDADSSRIKTYSGPGLTLDGGHEVWGNDEYGLAVEAFLGLSVHDADVGTVSEELTSEKAGAGIRLQGKSERGSPAYYLRLGFLYQYVHDHFVDDEGEGFYAGFGVEFELDDGWRIGPELLYSEAELDRFDQTDTSIGIRLSRSF